MLIYTNKSSSPHQFSFSLKVVLATDIVDKDLKNLRNSRWEKAFKKEEGGQHLLESGAHDAINRKATIILEHLIQASDISHTMQHWHIYRKWNEMFFQENLLVRVIFPCLWGPL